MRTLYYNEDSKESSELINLIKKSNLEIDLAEINEKVLGIPLASVLYKELGIDSVPALQTSSETIVGCKEITKYLNNIGQTQ